MMGISYAIPALQLVLKYQDETEETGNQDICYYNDLCRKPLGLVRDFNHVFSNLGYCVFGLLFMSIVLFKKLKYQKFLRENTSIDKEDYGVPTQYGLYFAMGLQSALLTTVAAALQVIALVWFTVSYIPGGQTGGQRAVYCSSMAA